MNECHHPHTEFVEAAEFCQMLVSRRTLFRQDDDGQGLRGLWDPEAETVYVIEEKKLARFQGETSSRLLAV